MQLSLPFQALDRLSLWASTNIPPSHQWFKTFGTVVCDGVRKTGYDIQIGPTYSLFIGKREFYLFFIEQKMEEIAHCLLQRHCEAYEMNCVSAWKSRTGLNIHGEWVAECTITTFDTSGLATLCFRGTTSARDLTACRASSIAIALCTCLGHFAHETTREHVA